MHPSLFFVWLHSSSSPLPPCLCLPPVGFAKAGCLSPLLVDRLDMNDGGPSGTIMKPHNRSANTRAPGYFHAVFSSLLRPAVPLMNHPSMLYVLKCASWKAVCLLPFVSPLSFLFSCCVRFPPFIGGDSVIRRAGNGNEKETSDESVVRFPEES
jgi:hypothetical protein